MSFSELLDTLVTELSAEYDREIEAARAKYFKRSGEPFQDEPAYEIRLGNFLEWYFFDYVLESGLTPFESYMADPAKPAANKTRFLPFRDQRHSIFMIEKIASSELLLNDLWTDEDIRVRYEETAGLSLAAALEARLVEIGKTTYPMNTMVYHAPNSAKFIKKRAKQLREAKRVQDWEPFLSQTSFLQLKAERYKHVEGETIYREILNETSAA